MTYRPMPVLSALTLLSLVILVLLGNWQYGRYSEKLKRQPVEASVFRPVQVRIDSANDGMAQQVYGIIDGEAVWRRYVPGRINGEGPIVLALWDATSGTEPVPLTIVDTSDFERRANVFERPHSQGGFARQNRPEENLWYDFDGAGMLANLGYTSESLLVVEPDIITIRLAGDPSRARQTENPYATPRVRDPLPPERHFGYALTWWGLALALVGVYVAFHHSRGRLRFRG